MSVTNVKELQEAASKKAMEFIEEFIRDRGAMMPPFGSFTLR